MAQNFLGSVLRDHRLRKDLTQEEVAAVLGITRQRYGQIESGKHVTVFEPERAIRICRLLDIEMLPFVRAMGFPLSSPSGPTQTEEEVLEAFRRAAPIVQEHIRRGLGLDT
jgi:transcriptional regulator with XRE-family HTH domain